MLDRALEREEFDFVGAISRELPIRFLCSIFTVPQDDADRLIRWGDRMIANQDPELSDAVVDRIDTEEYRMLPFRSPAALEVFEYADRQRELRMREPADDVINALTVAQAEGLLSEQDFRNYFSLLMIAGNETTRHTISHGMLALMEHPSQMELLQEEPSRISVATEEILRWATPVMHFRRTATRDVELGGQRIAEGDKVVTWYISANFDDAAFRGSIPVRRGARSQLSGQLRPGRPAFLPRRAPRAARDEDPLPGAASPDSVDRAGWTGRACALELRQRHQEDAGAGAGSLRSSGTRWDGQPASPASGSTARRIERSIAASSSCCTGSRWATTTPPRR